MKCMQPHMIYYDLENQKYSFVRPKKYNGNDCVFVPCGHCPACKKEWRTQLAQRVRYELLNYNYNERCFLTLTVNEQMIDEVFPNGSLNHSYFQKFIKRLRRYLEYHNIPHRKIKYLVSGEYGELNGRPHFHLILFGFKPNDMKYRGRSKKGYATYKSKLIEDLWGAGFVDVGDVDEHTAPYMVKYIVKYAEIKQRKIIDYEYQEVYDENGLRVRKTPIYEEFKINGVPVRKPYIVYPKKIMGIDYFLKNYKQILRNGYILDSNGKKHGIPKSFLKYAENSEDYGIMQEYNNYLVRVQMALEEENAYLNSLGLFSAVSKWQYYLEQGRIKREMYETFKNKNR